MEELGEAAVEALDARLCGCWRLDDGGIAAWEWVAGVWLTCGSSEGSSEHGVVFAVLSSKSCAGFYQAP